MKKQKCKLGDVWRYFTDNIDRGLVQGSHEGRVDEHMGEECPCAATLRRVIIQFLKSACLLVYKTVVRLFSQPVVHTHYVCLSMGQ